MMSFDANNKVPIHCWAWDRVYVKSNGRVPCWCDTGEPHTVIKSDFKNDFILDVVNHAQMRNMRLTVLRDYNKYIPQCESCSCLLTQGDRFHKRYLDSPLDNQVLAKSLRAMKLLRGVRDRRKWELGSIDRIRQIQIESSFACNLKCPGCLQGIVDSPLSTEEKPYILPYEWFTNIIDSISEHAVVLDRLNFVGRGEPTMNKRLGDMVVYCKANLPKTIINMDTNSTQSFDEDFLLMDFFNCSIDGSTAEAYQTYRRQGNFSNAISFMTKAVEAKNRLKRTCKIRWKYILFNTTEHPDLLIKAMQMAKDIGIDELDFVVTACGAMDGSVTPAVHFTTVQSVKDFIMQNNRYFANTVVSRS